MITWMIKWKWLFNKNDRNKKSTILEINRLKIN